MFRRTSLLAAAVGLLALGGSAQAGNLFITGHDSDEHADSAYMRTGLDYLAFGHAASGGEVAARATKKVGYIANGNNGTATINATGYTNFAFIDLDLVDFSTVDLSSYSILMVGSGGSLTTTSTGSAELNANAAKFTSFFNSGGGIFVNTDQGLGQSFYNFIPSFGTTTNNTISSAGQFTATAAGLAIGMTEAIVDLNITHSYYTGVNTGTFTVFETYNPTGDAVALGIRQATIDNGTINAVPVPAAAWSGLALMGVSMVVRRVRRAQTH